MKKMNSWERFDFTIEGNGTLDTCPACMRRITKTEINVTAQYVYVKMPAPESNLVAQSMGIQMVQIISCLAHDSCIEEYTNFESTGIYKVKPEKLPEILARGGR
jgi:hypothetical protein